ncbi:MAG: ComF family protein [Actinomycetota bacterium]
MGFRTHVFVQMNRIATAAVFDGEVREMIVALKYHNARRVARPLAALLADAVGRDRNVRRIGIDVVTWAPTSSLHKRRRGYDQAELIARELAQRLNLPAQRLLRRHGSVAQTGRSRRERLTGPAFRGRSSARGKRILVVDDVATTGATLHSARRALRAEGAEMVFCWAVAGTPAR